MKHFVCIPYIAWIIENFLSLIAYAKMIHGANWYSQVIMCINLCFSFVQASKD